MLGKFDSYRDSALHFLCSQEWGNESFGDVSTYGVYIWRISNTWEDVKPANKEFESVIEDWEEWAGLAEAHTSYGLRQSLVGHFMVSENEQGLVTVKQYALESELIRHFNQMQEHFNTWSIQTEMTNEGESY